MINGMLTWTFEMILSIVSISKNCLQILCGFFRLQFLEKEGLVDVIGHQPARGRGRPTKIFGLTDHAQMHNLNGLSEALLDTLFSCELSKKEVLVRVARNLFGTYQSASNKHSLLKTLVEKLNQLN